MTEVIQKRTRAERNIRWIEKHLNFPDGPKVGQPMVLAEFQKKWLRQIFDNEVPVSEVILSIPRKNAKALALDTPILTTAGWTTMGELEVGDYVYGSDGKPTRINTVSDIHFNRRCWKLTFSDGSEIVAADNHLWETTHKVRGTNRTSISNTEEIANSLYVPRMDGNKEYNHKIKLAGCIASPDVDLSIDPYVLGAWLGDGSSDCAAFTVSELDTPAMCDNLNACLSTPVSVNRYPDRAVTLRATGSGLQAELRSMRLLGRKHIPDNYLTAGTNQRWALLQGLMDTDGTVNRGNGKYPRPSFTGTNYKLCYGVWRLARSLGLKATLKSSEAKLNGKFVSECWKVSFPAHRGLPIFRLSRKQDILNETLSKRTYSVSIVGCEEVKSVPCVCISVDAEDKLFLAGHGLIVTHNTTLVASILLLYLCGPESVPNTQLYSCAQVRQQAAVVFNICLKMIQMSPALSAVVRPVKSQKELHCDARGTYYRAMSKDASGQYGTNPFLVIFDEIGQTSGPFDAQYEAMHTGTGVQQKKIFFLISTQAPRDSDFLSIKIKDFQDNPTPDRVLILHACPDDHPDPFSEDALRLANPAWDEFLNKDFMLKWAEQAKRIPSEESGYRNYALNQRVDTEAPFLTKSIWEANKGAVDPIDGKDVYIGVDLSRRNDVTGMVAMYHNDDGESYSLLPFAYLPANGLKEKAEADRTPWDIWVNQGLMIATPGNQVDYSFPAMQIKKLDAICNIVKIAIDPYNSSYFKQALIDVGFPEDWIEEKFHPFRQGFISLSPGVEELEGLFLNNRIRHGDHPVLRDSFQNAKVVEDAAENRKFEKMAPHRKKDLADCSVMAAAMIRNYDINNAKDKKKQYTGWFVST